MMCATRVGMRIQGFRGVERLPGGVDTTSSSDSSNSVSHSVSPFGKTFSTIYRSGGEKWTMVPSSPTLGSGMGLRLDSRKRPARGRRNSAMRTHEYSGIILRRLTISSSAASASESAATSC
jgi:hypothetical protein